ncbi:hypothetical protein [Lentilactobacillus kribbianus]|uniref:hypothetical protein n=1 Tax=Lentilactobacillus kribbianus TaxID=2729622 RepID=UPI0015541F95|nr:hypothetical protein [Lentilactobacillus kribbianus]
MRTTIRKKRVLALVSGLVLAFGGNVNIIHAAVTSENSSSVISSTNNFNPINTRAKGSTNNATSTTSNHWWWGHHHNHGDGDTGSGGTVDDNAEPPVFEITKPNDPNYYRPSEGNDSLITPTLPVKPGNPLVNIPDNDADSTESGDSNTDVEAPVTDNPVVSNPDPVIDQPTDNGQQSGNNNQTNNNQQANNSQPNDDKNRVKTVEPDSNNNSPANNDLNVSTKNNKLISTNKFIALVTRAGAKISKNIAIPNEDEESSVKAANSDIEKLMRTKQIVVQPATTETNTNKASDKAKVTSQNRLSIYSPGSNNQYTAGDKRSAKDDIMDELPVIGVAVGAATILGLAVFFDPFKYIV